MTWTLFWDVFLVSAITTIVIVYVCLKVHVSCVNTMMSKVLDDQVRLIESYMDSIKKVVDERFGNDG